MERSRSDAGERDLYVLSEWRGPKSRGSTCNSSEKVSCQEFADMNLSQRRSVEEVSN